MGLPQVTDLESFRRFFDWCVKMAREVFERDGWHSHMFFLIEKDRVGAMSFDMAVERAAKLVPGAAAKGMIFHALAEAIKKSGCRGYVDIAECWYASVGDSARPEEAVAKLMETWGSVKKIPTSVEILQVLGYFRGTRLLHVWKIRRGATGSPWLEEFDDLARGESLEEGGNFSVLEKAVDGCEHEK